MAVHQAQTIPKVVKLDSDITDRLERLSELKHRKVHWLMKEAIARYLEEEEYLEALKKETEARWQEAKTGQVVSNQAVTDWLDTWGTESETKRPPCGS